MPDWLNIDPDETPAPRPPRRRRRAEQQNDTTTRSGRGRWWIVAAVVVGVAVIAAAYAVPSLRQRPSEQSQPNPPATLAPPPPPQTSATASTHTVPATSSPSTSAATPATLEGRELAETWLRGYLTRSSRDDTAWTSEVTDHTSASLMEELTREGPNVVGFSQLTGPWRITGMEDWQPKEGLDASGPSRQITGTLVTVTDDQGHTVDKGIVLTAYLDEDGRWLVSMVATPYESEG